MGEQLRNSDLVDFTGEYCKAYFEFLKSMGVTKVMGNPLDEHDRCTMEIDISKITNEQLLNFIFGKIKDKED